MEAQLFEWVVVCNNEEFYLTENQYKYFLDNVKERQVKLDTFSLNPAFVSHCYRRPAEEILRKYPCRKCSRTGTYQGQECEDCSGTGFKV